MNRFEYVLVAVLVASGVLMAQTPDPRKTAPSSPAPAAQKSDSALDRILKDYEATFNKGDAKALAALYADNAIRLGLGNEVLHGRAEIENFYVASFTGKPGTLSLRPVRTHMLTPDAAVLEGRYEVAGATGIHGVYIVTAVRQGGQWKFASVVAVPDGP